MDSVARAITDNQSKPQQAIKCYNWVSLGTFDIGKWINGYGRETGSLPVGSGDELYEDDELWEEYDREHNRGCELAANHAYDNAINAMVRVGRYVDDIESERKRIEDFYQTNLYKCQAHFKRLYDKYKGKFCADQ